MTGHLEHAAAELTASIAARGPDMTRSTTFELTALATVYLRSGETDLGSRTGHAALDLAEQVRSIRTLDRLDPLHAAASHRQSSHDGVDALVERITHLRAA